jgi:type VI secretion system secreted protein Hcp
MPVDYYLKLGEIKGESTSEDEANNAAVNGAIELQNWSFGASNPANIGSATGGSGTGRASLSEISCMAVMSKASAELFHHCTVGKHVPKATITCRKAGDKQVTFLVLTLEEVYVSNYQTGGVGGGEVPSDSFSLAYGKISFDYKAQGANGVTTNAGAKWYDLRKNKGG